MKKLYLIFKNSDGSQKTMIIHHCHQQLKPEQVHESMRQISALHLFQRDGVQLYTEIVGAKYVERRTTWIFDDSKGPYVFAKAEQLAKTGVAESLTNSSAALNNSVYFTEPLAKSSPMGKSFQKNNRLKKSFQGITPDLKPTNLSDLAHSPPRLPKIR